MIDATTLPGPAAATPEEPITLAEAKAQVRQVFNDDDDYIAALIPTARMMLEGRINRAIVPQVVEFTAEYFAAGMRLPRAPYLDGLEVSYYGTDGVLATLPGADYYVEPSDEPPRLYPARGQVFPLVSVGPGSVRIKYRAGYPSPAAVPAPLKQWMKLAIGTLYDQRASVITGVSVTPLPEDFMSMLWHPYKVYI